MEKKNRKLETGSIIINANVLFFISLLLKLRLSSLQNLEDTSKEMNQHFREWLCKLQILSMSRGVQSERFSVWENGGACVVVCKSLYYVLCVRASVHVCALLHWAVEPQNSRITSSDNACIRSLEQLNPFPVYRSSHMQL